MENNLDEIANGDKKWDKILAKFYKDFHNQIEKLKELKPLVEDKYTHKLGVDPETGYEIVSTIGMHGPMIKLCGPTKSKCKFAPIKKPLTIESITFKDALKLFEYPKNLGKFERKSILLQTGRFGFYIKHGKLNYTVESGNITFEQALEVIKKKREEKKGLGQFESEKRIYTILDGRYGKYIRVEYKNKKDGKQFNVSLPKDTDHTKLDLEKIEKIITDKFNKPKNKKKPIKKKVAKKVIKKAKKDNITIQ